MTRPSRGFREAFRDTRLKRDPAALAARAAQEQVELGVYSPQQLRNHGVGVPPLWKASVRLSRQSPLGIRAFQTLTQPPASCLWVAASTRAQIFASLHIEFVGDIARVCEALEIEAGGATGREYRLTLEPVDHVMARCLDTAGFGADVAEDLLSRVRGWVPWQWVPDKDGQTKPRVVPEERLRNLVVALERIPGAPVVVTEQRRENVDDVPVLPDSPSRGDMRATLRALFVESR